MFHIFHNESFHELKNYNNIKIIPNYSTTSLKILKKDVLPALMHFLTTLLSLAISCWTSLRCFIFKCCPRLALVGKFWSQIWQENCLWIFLICWFRTSLEKYSFPHWLHFSSLILSWSFLICPLSRFFSKYFFPQWLHLKRFMRLIRLLR